MFRTIKLKLPYDRTLIETAKQFKEATQIVLNYGFEKKHSIKISSIKVRIKLLGKQYPPSHLPSYKLPGIWHQKH